MDALFSTLNPAALAGLAAASFVTTFAILRGLIRLFYRYGLLDNPAKYGYDRAPVPYGVGMALWINLALWSPVLYAVLPEKALLLAAFGALVTAVSFWDDRRPLSPKVRLALQLGIAAFIGVSSIKIGYVSGLFGGIQYLDAWDFSVGPVTVYPLPLLVTMAWYVLVFNATNWSDGIPGLTSGLSAVVFLVMAVLAVRLYLVDATQAARENSLFVLAACAVMIPACLALCFHDFRSKAIMGDAGSMFLGFMIASLAILAGGKVATAAAVFGLYIVDAFYVILLRLWRRQNPMKGDRNVHLHHRLLQVGLTPTQVRVTIYGVALVFGLAAAFTDAVGKAVIFALVALFTVLVAKVLSLVKPKGDKA